MSRLRLCPKEACDPAPSGRHKGLGISSAQLASIYLHRCATNKFQTLAKRQSKNYTVSRTSQGEEIRPRALLRDQLRQPRLIKQFKDMTPSHW